MSRTKPTTTAPPTPRVAPNTSEPISALSLLTEEWTPYALCDFEGMLTSTTLKVRNTQERKATSASPGKRRRAREVPTGRVVEFLAVDRTGVTDITLWDEHAEHLQKLLANFLGSNGQQAKPIIQITNARVQKVLKSKYNGDVLRKIATLSTVRETVSFSSGK